MHKSLMHTGQLT